MQYTAVQVHLSNKEDLATDKCALIEEDISNDYEKAAIASINTTISSVAYT